MQEVSVKTHLIVTDIHEEYFIKWCGKIMDAKPLFQNNLPIFVIISSTGRVELNTADMQLIENRAKSMTNPHGRAAITTDIARIYIKEENDNEKLIGKVIHNHIKQYAPMFDKVGYRD